MALIILQDSESIRCNNNFYFLNWLTFKSHQSQNSSCNCNFVTLGENRHEWWRATLETRKTMYTQLLTASREILASKRGYEISFEQVEILLGHICMCLAGRIARAIAQINNVPKPIEVISSQSSFTAQRPKTSRETYDLIASHEFGLFVESEILAIRGINADRISLDLDFTQTSPQVQPRTNSKFLVAAYVSLQKLFSPLTRKSRFLIVSSYLGRNRETLLNLSLGQAPLLVEIGSREVQNQINSPEPAVTVPASRTLENLFCNLMEVLIPRIMLANEVDDRQLLSKKGWPENPEVVFTSNSFDTDDYFKLLVSAVYKDCCYIVAQHGNNYGIALESTLYPETWTADKFLSWGWTGPENVVPIGIVKPRIRISKNRHKTGFLVILRDQFKYSLESDSDFNFETYISRVKKFVNELSFFGLKIKIRPHSSTPLSYLLDLWGEIVDGVSVEFSDCATPLNRALKNAFPVFTYDSTGLLEFASHKIPFTAYIPDGLQNIRLEYRRNYLFLEEAGLLSENCAASVENIGRIIDCNFDLSASQTAALDQFCHGICFTNKRLIRDLRLSLKSSARESVVPKS